ncbi:MAG TPA: hypothetical protein VF384_17310 [Planctomycetota bacterium]
MARILVALGILACLLVAMFAWSRQEPSLGTGAAEYAPARAVDVETAARDAGAAEPLAREPASSASSSAPPGEPQHLKLVVLWPDNRPGAGAEVRYWPPRCPEQRERDQSQLENDEDLETALTATGVAASTDAHGAVTLAVDAHSKLCVRSGDHYAELDLAESWDFAPPQYIVVLERDVTLRVLAVDAAGRPREGVQVRGDCVAESRRLGRRAESLSGLHTDADGLARVAHLQRQFAMPGPDTIGWSLTVGCGDRAFDRVVSWGELTNPEPLRFVLPVAGAVAARIVDGIGAPWGGNVHLIDADSGQVLGVDSYDWKQRVHWFRQVPLGRRWQLRCPLEAGPPRGADRDARGDAQPHPVTTELLGPQEADAVVAVSVHVPECWWAISGRIVRSDGQRLPEAQVTVRAAAFGERKLSGDGIEVRCMLPQSVAAISDFTIEVRDPMLPEPLLVRVDQPLLPGRTKLEPVVVPVPAVETLLATVEVRCAGRSITGSSRLWLAAVGASERTSVFTVRRDEGPTSRLWGAPCAGELELHCTHAGCRGTIVSIRAGAACVVELQPTAELLVRTLPPAIPRRFVACELVGAGETDATRLDPNGQFHWTSVTTGTYALRILAMDRVLWQLPSFELCAGANIWPPDGTCIDLRGAVRAIHVDVRPADGQGCIDDFLMFLVPADQVEPPADFGAMRLYTDKWFVPSTRPADVLVHADGFVPVRVANPAADTVVPMQRCTTVQCTGADSTASCTVRVVDSPLRDPILLALHREHDEQTTEFGGLEFEVSHPPGTVLELAVVRGGRAAPPLRVVVGTESPQRVVLD